MELPIAHNSALFFRPSLRTSWKLGETRGGLVDKWCREDPFLFDLDNLRNAIHQCSDGFHFGEWFTAIALFRRFGHHAIVNKYTFRSHIWKTDAFDNIVVEPDARAFLRAKVKGKH